jgi:hypothetical protein
MIPKIEDIFIEKSDFHIIKSKESVELKVKKLIELQKITLAIKPDINKNSSYEKKIWKI